MFKDVKQAALDYHSVPTPGKIGISLTKPAETQYDLSLAYSPGVAEPVREIAKDPINAYKYTSKGNLVAVISNGSAILGLGDLGPLASKPVMEGKALLFKRFADLDSIDIEVDTQDSQEFIDTVKRISGTFGGINLEDIKAPECFEIERILIDECNIPIFHDDQHGTAIVTLAALTNALRVVGKRLEDVRITMTGAGAAGVAILKILQDAGATNIVICDRDGAIHRGVPEVDDSKQWLQANTNPEQRAGSVSEVIAGSDVFIGVSGPGVLTEDDVASMADDAIVFAMANPEPEIDPAIAARHARVVATGRSDYPNQINNVLAFPGVFRGALNAKARDITEEMKVAAAHAIANVVSADELHANYIVPSVFNAEVAPAVAAAVERVAANGAS